MTPTSERQLVALSKAVK